MVVTSSNDMRYLRKEEIAQLDNFPPYLAELKVAKCGTTPGNDEPDNKKETYINCTKAVNVALYGEGAQAYLKKYDSPSGISPPGPAAQQGTASSCLDVSKQSVDRLSKIADAWRHMTTATGREQCTFGRATEIPTYTGLLATANQNGCAGNITILREGLDQAIRRTNDICRRAGL
jgi:hypothetical protein